MALYTLLVKVDEDERSVRYRFGPAEGRMGLVELDKVGGPVRELESVPGVATQTDLPNAPKQLFRLLANGEPLPRHHFPCGRSENWSLAGRFSLRCRHR